jgi:RNA polymerase sigma-70 factor (ECF subfamily)
VSRFRRRPGKWDETTTDEELVEWTRGGQREAFGVLYDRHHLSVYGYCYRCLGNREAAEDATGEAFRKALMALPAYRAGAFRSWLFAIARNVVVDEVRARRPVVSLETAADVYDEAPSPEEVAATAADVDVVVGLLPRLTAEQRDAVALRLAGFGPAEIGEVLGKSRAAIDMTLHRALIQLRELMAIAPIPAKGGGRRE